MIEVKDDVVKVSGNIVGIMADYSRLTNALINMDGINKDDIEHAVKVGLMTDEERHEEVVRLMDEIKKKLKETCKKTEVKADDKKTEDKPDDEIKKAIDTIVQHFTENM